MLVVPYKGKLFYETYGSILIVCFSGGSLARSVQESGLAASSGSDSAGAPDLATSKVDSVLVGKGKPQPQQHTTPQLQPTGEQQPPQTHPQQPPPQAAPQHPQAATQRPPSYSPVAGGTQSGTAIEDDSGGTQSGTAIEDDSKGGSREATGSPDSGNEQATGKEGIGN